LNFTSRFLANLAVAVVDSDLCSNRLLDRLASLTKLVLAKMFHVRALSARPKLSLAHDWLVVYAIDGLET